MHLPTGEYIRGLVSYDELEYVHPDCDALTKRIQEIQVMVTDGTDSETIKEAYEALISLGVTNIKATQALNEIEITEDSKIEDIIKQLLTKI